MGITVSSYVDSDAQTLANALAAAILGPGIMLSAATFVGNLASAGPYTGHGDKILLSSGGIFSTGLVVNGEASQPFAIRDTSFSAAIQVNPLCSILLGTRSDLASPESNIYDPSYLEMRVALKPGYIGYSFTAAVLSQEEVAGRTSQADLAGILFDSTSIINDGSQTNSAGVAANGPSFQGPIAEVGSDYGTSYYTASPIFNGFQAASSEYHVISIAICDLSDSQKDSALMVTIQAVAASDSSSSSTSTTSLSTSSTGLSASILSSSFSSTSAPITVSPPSPSSFPPSVSSSISVIISTTLSPRLSSSTTSQYGTTALSSTLLPTPSTIVPSCLRTFGLVASPLPSAALERRVIAADLIGDLGQIYVSRHSQLVINNGMKLLSAERADITFFLMSDGTVQGLHEKSLTFREAGGQILFANLPVAGVGYPFKIDVDIEREYLQYQNTQPFVCVDEIIGIAIDASEVPENCIAIQLYLLSTPVKTSTFHGGTVTSSLTLHCPICSLTTSTETSTSTQTNEIHISGSMEITINIITVLHVQPCYSPCDDCPTEIITAPYQFVSSMGFDSAGDKCYFTYRIGDAGGTSTTMTMYDSKCGCTQVRLVGDSSMRVLSTIYTNAREGGESRPTGAAYHGSKPYGTTSGEGSGESVVYHGSSGGPKGVDSGKTGHDPGYSNEGNKSGTVLKGSSGGTLGYPNDEHSNGIVPNGPSGGTLRYLNDDDRSGTLPNGSDGGAVLYPNEETPTYAQLNDSLPGDAPYSTKLASAIPSVGLNDKGLSYPDSDATNTPYGHQGTEISYSSTITIELTVYATKGTELSYSSTVTMESIVYETPASETQAVAGGATDTSEMTDTSSASLHNIFLATLLVSLATMLFLF